MSKHWNSFLSYCMFSSNDLSYSTQRVLVIPLVSLVLGPRKWPLKDYLIKTWFLFLYKNPFPFFVRSNHLIHSFAVLYVYIYIPLFLVIGTQTSYFLTRVFFSCWEKKKKKKKLMSTLGLPSTCLRLINYFPRFIGNLGLSQLIAEIDYFTHLNFNVTRSCHWWCRWAVKTPV